MPPDGFFGWIIPTFSFSLAWIETHRGIDAMLYQRFLRSLMIFFAVFTVINFLTVVPANAAGHHKNLNSSDPLFTDGLKIISMANVESDSVLLWIHAIMVVFEVVCTILLVFWDYSCFFSARQRYRTLPTTDHCSVMVSRLDDSLLSGDTADEKRRKVTEYFEEIFPGSVRCVYLVRDDPILQKLVEERAKTKDLFEQSLHLQEQGGSPTHHAGVCGCCVGKSVDSVAHYTGELKQQREDIVERQSWTNPKLCNVAFITFSSLEAAETSLKQKPDPRHKNLEYEPAAPAAAVLWKNLSVGHHAKGVRRLVVNVCIGFLVCFWAIPTAMVQTLGNLRELAKYPLFDWLNTFLDALGPTIEGLLNAYLPSLLLIGLMAMVVPVIKLLTREEGLSTLIKTDRSVFERYLLFILFNVFLVSTIAGSFLNKIFAIFEGQERIIDLLAKSLPGQGEFFIEYVMLKFAFLIINKLLRIDDVIIRWIKLKLAKSESDKLKVNHAPRADRAILLAWDMLVFQITLCYSIMYPFILIFGAAYFATAFFVHQYNCVYVFTKDYETEGSLWEATYHYFFISTIIFQLTMIGLLSISESYSPLLLFISIILTLLAWVTMRRRIEAGKFGFVATPSTDPIEFMWKAAGNIFSKSKQSEPLLSENKGLLSHYGTDLPFNDTMSPVYYRQPDMEPLTDDLDFGWKKRDSEFDPRRKSEFEQ